jgi:hypothetical protein
MSYQKIKWSTEGVTQAGAEAALVYRDKDTGSYCQFLRLPEGFDELNPGEESKKPYDGNDYDEVIYIVSRRAPTSRPPDEHNWRDSGL